MSQSYDLFEDPYNLSYSLPRAAMQCKMLIRSELDRAVKRHKLPPDMCQPPELYLKHFYKETWKLVGSLSYDDGWHFGIVADKHTMMPYLQVILYVEDAQHPGRWSEGHFYFPFPWYLEELPAGDREEQILMFFARCITDIEHHEIFEKIKIDGEAPFFPHDPVTGQGHYDMKLYPGWRDRRKPNPEMRILW